MFAGTRRCSSSSPVVILLRSQSRQSKISSSSSSRCLQWWCAGAGGQQNNNNNNSNLNHQQISSVPSSSSSSSPHLRLLSRRTDVLQCPPSISARSLHTSRPLSAPKDLYKTLGLSRGASAKEIKKAYYELAKKYHPDTNKNDPNSAKKFQEVSEAYQVLSDDSKRKQYDEFGSTDFGAGAGGAPGGGNPFSGFQGFSSSSFNSEDLFRKVFEEMRNFGGGGGGGGGGGSSFAEDFGFSTPLQVELSLSFNEAAKGIKKDVLIDVIDTCPKCNGSKSQGDEKPVKCPYCHGTGMETISNGPFIMRTTCRACHGTRVHIKNPCRECHGQGVTQQRKKVQIPVPAGVDDGQSLRMKVGNKELYINFRVAKSNYFRRDGPDIHSEVEISLPQALLGGTADIQGLYENLNISIPAGTGSHARIRLAEKGIARVNSYGKGDHYVHVKIKVNKNLTKKQRALALVLAELDDTGIKGTINGIISTREGGRVIEGDAEFEEYVNLIKSALEDAEDDKDKNSDRS